MSGDFTLHVPVCVNDPWPTDLATCLTKFEAYNARIKGLFVTRNRAAEIPSPMEWSMEPGKLYTSTCLLWDVLHVYHMIGALHWNEGMRILKENKDPKQARRLFVECYKFFSCISEKILPVWQPVCRAVYQLYETNTRTLTFPPFLIGDNWASWCLLTKAMIQRCLLEKAISESSASAISKVAMGGYKILSTIKEKLEPKEAHQFMQNQLLSFKWQALYYWTKANDENADVLGTKINVLKDLAVQLGKVKTLSGDLEPLKNAKAEAEKWEKLNSTIYFQKISGAYNEKEVLEILPAADLTNNLQPDLECCVV